MHLVEENGSTGCDSYDEMEPKQAPQPSILPIYLKYQSSIVITLTEFVRWIPVDMGAM